MSASANEGIGRAPGGPEYGSLVLAARRLLDAIAAADAPDEACRAATARVLAACEGLEPHAVGEDAAAANRRADLPSMGNPMLIPFVVTDTGPGEVRGTATFSRAHLGGGGAAHGGTIPLLFDDVLGRLASPDGGRTPTRTAYLHVNYRAVTPLGVPLAVLARVDRVERRKVFVSGRLLRGETLLADAEGLFIMMRPEQLWAREVR